MKVILSLIRPKIVYCSQLWYPLDQNSIAKLKSIQCHLTSKVGGMEDKYHLSREGGISSPPTTPHCLQYLTACLIQNGQRGLEISQTLYYWTPEQLSQNKFFDSRTSKIQNGRQGALKWLMGS